MTVMPPIQVKEMAVCAHMALTCPFIVLSPPWLSFQDSRWWWNFLVDVSKLDLMVELFGLDLQTGPSSRTSWCSEAGSGDGASWLASPSCI